MTRISKLLLAVLTSTLIAAGLAATTAPASAVAYGGYYDWKTISAGGAKTCAIRTTGTLSCWKTNGTGGSLYSISGYSDWKSVSAGSSHQCAIRGSGYLYCWGDDSRGQVGDGATSTAFKTSPKKLGTWGDWKSVSAGGTHTCAIRGTGTLYCWGNDSDGQVGDGSASSGDKTAPKPVYTRTDWKTVSAGDTHTCATRGTGLLYCWGNDSDGQVGDGSTSTADKTAPKPVNSSVTNWRSVSAGGNHTCGILGTGLTACWGSDTRGQLGNGGFGSHQSPSKINSSMSDWTTVRAGGSHTCGIRGSGALYCWGDNSYSQSSSATNPAQSPDRYGTLSDWKATDTGPSHSCGIRGSGSLYCWGKQTPPSIGTPAGSAYPAQLSSLGYLKAWKVTLPVDSSTDDDTYADEIKQPTLATYRSLSYFHTNSDNTAVVLRAPVGGARTPGSVFARTELRNMIPYPGSGSAKSYNWTSGTHVLEMNQAYTHLPKLLPKVVGMQIHDPDHEVLMVRLDGTRLYAQLRQLNGTYSEVTFTNSYQLGTRFNLKVTANANGVFVDYNGVRKASFAGRRPSSTAYWYFKAGCYLHSKTSAGEAPDEYGEVLIHSLKVTHS